MPDVGQVTLSVSLNNSLCLNLLSGTLVAVVCFIRAVNAGSTKVPAPPYATQSWPAAPLLVWAKPGKDGAFRVEDNWRPRRQPDENTDVLLPASHAPYHVSTRGERCRHITIERNAAVIAAKAQGGKRPNLQIWGNIWVKRGGRIHGVEMRGTRHTFLRLDGGVFPRGAYPNTARGWIQAGGFKRVPSSMVAERLVVTKWKNGSTELIGNIAD